MIKVHEYVVKSLPSKDSFCKSEVFNWLTDKAKIDDVVIECERLNRCVIVEIKRIN